MEKTTHIEEHTKVVEHDPIVADTHVTDKKHKNKTKKNKKVKDTQQYGPKKTFGTKVKEFFTGRRDDGIIYQNGLPIAGLNGPIVQPMGAPIRQPAEIHPVATVTTTPMTVGHIPGEHIHGPTTTTYEPVPPLQPGLGEGYARTTTTTDYVQPGAEIIQPMNAIAQPTGLGAIVQPAGVIIAKKDKHMNLQEGYLKDQKIHAYPHERVRDKPMTNPHAHHDKHAHKDKHHHEESYTNTTSDYIAPAPIVEQQVYPVNTVPAEPAPAIFTGPARVLEEKHVKEKHVHDDRYDKKEIRKEEKLQERELHEQKHLHTNIDQQIPRPNAYMQPTVLPQQPLPVTVLGPNEPGFIPPTGGVQPNLMQQQQPMPYTDYHETHHKEQHIKEHQQFAPTTTVVNEQPVILQQPGMAPSNQPVVRNHQQVPMTSQSGLQQGGMFQNDTARPVQTFTPVLQQNQPLTEAPILNQAAYEQNAFAPSGIRTKEGLVETRLPANAKHTNQAGYEERKETVVNKDIKY